MTSTAPELTVLDHFPTGLLHINSRDLYTVLSGPTLIHLPGRQPEPLFVSILLHGNEDIGLLAIQELLKAHTQTPLPRALSIFIGNVQAARHGQRQLADQPDYNRIWPGSELGGFAAEHRIMANVVQHMQHRGVFASIDLHNNTGLNPHYACVNTLDHTTLHLATLFSRTVVYFTRPRGVQSLAFSALCPAVTLECGRVGDQRGVRHANEFLHACLHLQQLPQHPVAAHDIDLYHTVASVKIPPHIDFDFGNCQATLCLNKEIEQLNFSELQPGQCFAHTSQPLESCWQVTDEHGNPVTNQYFCKQQDAIVLQRSVMPSMLTTNSTVIRQDCLGYLMERYPLYY